MPRPSSPSSLPEWDPDSAPCWAARVAATADLPDQRLNARMAGVLEMFANKPSDYIPQAAGTAADAKAAYRFLSNRRFSHQELCRPLADATAKACAGMSKVFVVQDTTSFNYSTRQHTKGLGPLNDSAKARGLHLHSALAVSADGIVQGVLDVNLWRRSAKKRARGERCRLSIKQKESYRWISAIQKVRDAMTRNLPEASRPQLIHLMDREGDIHEVFEEILKHGDGAIIRCAQNRTIDDPVHKAHEAVQRSPLLGIMTIDVPGKNGQGKRSATVELRALIVTLQPDVKKHPKRRPLTLTLVEACEASPADGVEGIYWRLWTAEHVENLEQAVAVVTDYGNRWRVEEYHLVFKSGCQVEQLGLETAERLCKALTLYAAVAARIVALRDLGRRDPNAPCTRVLTQEEWHVLVRRFEKRRPQANEPPATIRQAMLWIGRLGGHLGRKRDPLPGVRVLWRGWRDLALLVDGYRVAQQLN